MAATQFSWSEVGGQRLMERFTTARVELWITVVCLNFALAGVFAMATVACGWGRGQTWWAFWLFLGVLLSVVTSRRLRHLLAPLFWLPACTQNAHASCATPGMPATPNTASIPVVNQWQSA